MYVPTYTSYIRAECIIYTVKIDIGDPTLKLYPGFEVMLF